MMRRGMNGKGKQIEAYIDYETWARGGTTCRRPRYGRCKQRQTSIELGNALNGWKDIATADRTMWNQKLDDQKAGVIAHDANGNENLATYPIKYLRSAVCSGQMDGERLASFNKFFTGGFTIIRDNKAMSTGSSRHHNHSSSTIRILTHQIS